MPVCINEIYLKQTWNQFKPFLMLLLKFYASYLSKYYWGLKSVKVFNVFSTCFFSHSDLLVVV